MFADRARTRVQKYSDLPIGTAVHRQMKDLGLTEGEPKLLKSSVVNGGPFFFEDQEIVRGVWNQTDTQTRVLTLNHQGSRRK